MIVNSPLLKIKWVFKVVKEVTIRVGWEPKWALDVIHSVMEHSSEEHCEALNAPIFASNIFLAVGIFGLTAW